MNDLLLADGLFAWAFGIAIIFYGLHILTSGHYISRAGELVEDTVRVWMGGGLMVAIGALIILFLCSDWSPDKRAATSDTGKPSE
jgi:hypothetical protein